VEEEIPKIRPGYQVVDADMFSHAYDPVVRFTRRSIAFNSTCIARLIDVYTAPDGLDAKRCQYVEFLFNPIEKMVAVRPCSLGESLVLSGVRASACKARAMASPRCRAA
jgi:hypothetical protein